VMRAPTARISSAAPKSKTPNSTSAQCTRTTARAFYQNLPFPSFSFM
jgi:hypothetical protein